MDKQLINAAANFINTTFLLTYYGKAEQKLSPMQAHLTKIKQLKSKL